MTTKTRDFPIGMGAERIASFREARRLTDPTTN